MEFQQLVAVMPWTLVLQIGNLLLQIWIIKRFFVKPIRAILEQRQAEVDGDLDAAAQAKQQAKTARREYENRLAGAEEEAADVVRTATQNARSHSQQILAEAKQTAAAMREKATVDIARERKMAVQELKKDLSGIAVSIASKVVEKEIREKDHEKLIRDFIDRMGDAV